MNGAEVGGERETYTKREGKKLSPLLLEEYAVLLEEDAIVAADAVGGRRGHYRCCSCSPMGGTPPSCRNEVRKGFYITAHAWIGPSQIP